HTQQAPANLRSLVQAAQRPNDFAFTSDPKPEPLAAIVGLFVGPHVRAVGAAVLLAACALWAYQNGLLPGAEVKAQAAQALESQDLSGLEQQAVLDAARATRPLALNGVPPAALGWVDSFNVGLAGLMLLASLCFRGNLMGVLVLVGAGVAIVGHQFGIRPVEPFRDYHVSLMLGAVLSLVGFRLGSR
ncbi:MAG: hypothetical protein K2V38_17060, partial [Gemmataceae bacterium]|nr:hypothetical protein [Gemmataceae bacterium]